MAKNPKWDKVQLMKSRKDIMGLFFPEIHVNGYTSIDGTVEFYTRVGSLLDESMLVLDFGAGRGAWFEEDASEFLKKTRTLKGKAKWVVGCDVDEAIFSNNSVDEQVRIEQGARLPFDDGKFDVIVCDYVFEHISNPSHLVGELHRILKKGGWIAARTPNKFSMVSIFTRLINNSLHPAILKYAQPTRKEIDIFPKHFKLNSIRNIEKYISPYGFINHTYRYEPEPAYYFGNRYILGMMLMLNKFLPSVMKSTLMIFLRKE